MKICVIGTRGFPYVEGGVEKHCEQLYPLLGEENEIIVFRRKEYVKREDVCENVIFVDLPSTKIKGVEAFFHSFLATVYSFFLKPDIVHFHNIGPAFFIPLAKLFGFSTILTYHSPNYEHDKWSYLEKKILLLCEKVALSCADKIIFVNKYQLNKYTDKIRKKAVYIPNGIAEPEMTERKEYLEALGVEPKNYILAVGRITPEKGFHTLIEAFRMAKLSGYKLVIAGGVNSEASYFETLKKQAEDAPVIFSGYVHGEELNQLYTNAAIFVLSSENEGFPLVLLEAMSYGLDILVSDIPATHLVNLENDDYFPVGNVDILSKKLKERLKLIKNRAYSLDKYNWRHVAQDVLQIYFDIHKNRKNLLREKEAKR